MLDLFEVFEPGWHMKVLVVGASGMIGSAMFRVLSGQSGWTVNGTIRNSSAIPFFAPSLRGGLIICADLIDPNALTRLFISTRPDVVVNCAGLTKHKSDADDPIAAIPPNSMLPHRMADLCSLTSARLIHISTDCVFSGKKGGYAETDHADAEDVYGRSKLLGEVAYPHTVTLRTSTIGHELNSAFGLLNWFLSQDRECRGYERAVFSGLPTVVFAEIVRDLVIPRPALSGIFHVGADPINKFELLKLISAIYEKKIQIIPDQSIVIDRSLDTSLFRSVTGYVPAAWDQLIQAMYTSRRDEHV